MPTPARSLTAKRLAQEKKKKIKEEERVHVHIQCPIVHIEAPLMEQVSQLVRAPIRDIIRRPAPIGRIAPRNTEAQPPEVIPVRKQKLPQLQP